MPDNLNPNIEHIDVILLTQMVQDKFQPSSKQTMNHATKIADDILLNNNQFEKLLKKSPYLEKLLKKSPYLEKLLTKLPHQDHVRYSLKDVNHALFSDYNKVAQKIADSIKQENPRITDPEEISKFCFEKIHDIYDQQLETKSVSSKVQGYFSSFPNLHTLSLMTNNFKNGNKKFDLKGKTIHLSILPPNLAQSFQKRINKINDKEKQAAKLFGYEELNSDSFLNQGPKVGENFLSDTLNSPSSSLVIHSSLEEDNKEALDKGVTSSVTVGLDSETDAASLQTAVDLIQKDLATLPKVSLGKKDKNSDSNDPESDKVKIDSGEFDPTIQPVPRMTLEDLLASLFANLREFSLGSATIINASRYNERIEKAEGSVDRKLQIAKEYQSNKEINNFTKSKGILEKFTKLNEILNKMDIEANPNAKNSVGQTALKVEKYLGSFLKDYNSLKSKTDEPKINNLENFKEKFGLSYVDATVVAKELNKRLDSGDSLSKITNVLTATKCYENLEKVSKEKLESDNPSVKTESSPAPAGSPESQISMSVKPTPSS